MGRSKTDNFLLIGLSHKTAPISVRERFSFGKDTIPPLLESLRGDNEVCLDECVLISTCNRTELYAYVSKPAEEVAPRVLDFILDHKNETDTLSRHFYIKTGNDVVEHLFKVVSGIDSMILGEPQIFGQVKSAYSLANDYDCTGPALNRLFHHAFQVGKNVRNSTSIGKGVVSISSAVVKLAEQTLGSLDLTVTVLVGAGKIGELCAKQLAGCNTEKFYIINRTHERALDLTSRLDGTALPFDRLPYVLGEADIVVSSVAGSEPVITASMIDAVLPERGGRPMVLVDLGVPRNIEPSIGERDGITVFNIDDLEKVITTTHDRRLGEVAQAQEIIEREMEGFSTWLSERDVVPVIHDLRKKCENTRLAELERIKNKVSAEEFRTIDLVTRRIIRKILHNPTVTVRSSESEEMRQQLIDSIHELFIKEAE